MTVLERTWFEITAEENFEKYLTELKPRRCLQLGCFCGDATVWMLSHFPEAGVVDIDTFEGSDEHVGIFDMGQVRRVYERVTAMYSDRLVTMVGTTDVQLRFLRGLADDVWFDFIYVDADHHSAAVLADAVLAWPMLVPGGLMAFDDYAWGQSVSEYEKPSTGIDAFLSAYGDQLDLIHKYSQLWVKKR